MTGTAKDRIIVPLDVSSAESALKLVEALREHVGLFKIGLELLNSAGIQIIPSIVQLGGKVFLDGKFNDIPNTVAGACRGVARLPISMLNVHALGGLEMMQAAVKAISEETLNSKNRPLVLAVTVLTSIDQNIMNAQLRIPGTIESQVVHLAALATDAGIDGIIASPQEIKAIRKVVPNVLIVTPGVRPNWADVNDQRRVMTPGEAILGGASFLVIGRPILKPPDRIGSPREAAIRIGEEIEDALARKGF